ncbi:MAG TPA: hypothetical protein VF720_13165 [Candidatus Eisenbacteria bacterium]
MRLTLVHAMAAGAAALLMFTLLPAPVRAQSTSFTYQGLLDNGAGTASGLHDFQFRLFALSAAGVDIAPPVCIDNVMVDNGVFTAQLDFGQAYITTAERWVEVSVRQDTGLGCGDPTGFVTLAPRQPITAAPMASHARSAFALDAADGNPASAVYVDDAGKVGIGTTTPAWSLHVKALGPVLVLQDTNTPANQAGYVTFWNNVPTETAWVGFGSPGSADFSMYNGRAGGDLLFYAGGSRVILARSNGDVGIGTGAAAPTGKLDVRGDIKLGPTGQYQATCGEEKLRVVRGKVSAAGGILLGSGFTASRSSVGTYLISFSPAFPAGQAPAVTVSAEWTSGSAYIAMTNGVLSSGTGVRVTNGSGTLVDQVFYFTAVGLR